MNTPAKRYANSGNGQAKLMQKPQRALWLDILMELGIFAAVYIIYEFSRGSIDAKASVALAHSHDIFSLEKSLSIDIERSIQSFFLRTDFRIDVANTLYTVCYYPSLVIFAIWAYWRHRAKYKFVRTVFVISAALAFVVFALYPVAPPRFFDGNHLGTENLGFVDTIFTHWHAKESSIKEFYNPFAAMPSLHQGWTLMIGVGIWWMTRSWFGRAIAVILPAAMFIGITSTANHFVLDAVGGAVLISVAFGLTALIWKYRARRDSEGEAI